MRWYGLSSEHYTKVGITHLGYEVWTHDFSHDIALSCPQTGLVVKSKDTDFPRFYFVDVEVIKDIQTGKTQRVIWVGRHDDEGHPEQEADTVLLPPAVPPHDLPVVRLYNVLAKVQPYWVPRDLLAQAVQVDTDTLNDLLSELVEAGAGDEVETRTLIPGFTDYRLA